MNQAIDFISEYCAKEINKENHPLKEMSSDLDQILKVLNYRAEDLIKTKYNIEME